MLVYHRVDFDGIFSCLIAKKALEDLENKVEIFGYNYGDDLPGPDYVSAFDVLVMVDVSFPPEVMKDLKMYVNNVIWIDHHITAIESSILKGYNSLEGIRDTSLAACELVWNYFYPNIKIPIVVEYIGCYDIWNKSRYDWDSEILPFQYYLRSAYPTYPVEDFYELFDKTDHLSEYLSEGKAIIRYLEKSRKTAVKVYSFEITIGGRPGICILSTEFNKSVFDSVSDTYDIFCFANRVGEDKYSVSLRTSREDFSVGQYLKEKYNGGGHPQAAGCTINQEQFFNLLKNKEL